MKEEIVNIKVPFLQRLIDRIGQNARLKDFHHTSSKAVREFIILISDYLTDTIVSEIKESAYWLTVVDETTDVTEFQQYITFAQYVNKMGKRSTAFLDIRRVDERGAAAVNLFNMWNNAM